MTSSNASASRPRPLLARVAICAAMLTTPAATPRAAEVDLMKELALAAREAGVDLDLPTWDLSGEAELGFGYADNVTLASLAPERSALARVAANGLAWRGVGEALEWVGYADGTHTRYFSGPIDDATLIITRAEARWKPEGPWQGSLAAQGIFQDEVIDASSLENDLGSVHARLASAALLGSLACDVSRSWTLAARPSVRRFDYRAPLDDFTETEGEIAISRTFASSGTTTLAARALSRDYDERPQAGPVGRPIYGTHLAVRQLAAELRHDIGGGRETRWSARARTAYVENRDNGSGYYDYDRWTIDLRGSVDRGAWTVEADVGWLDTTYCVQLVGFGIAPQRRARSEWRGYLRIEREIGSNVTLFAEWDATDSDSNDLFIDYGSSIALVGMRLTY